MKLTIVTLTAGSRPEALARCTASVQIAMEGLDAQHIVQTTKQFTQARLDSLKIPTDFLCFVDDDDVVTPDAFKKCLAALADGKNAVAFTYEQLVDEAGNVTGVRDKPKRWEDLSASPMTLHHLVVFKPSIVPDLSTILSSTKVGVDWLIKASAAAKGGAIQVPYIGYHWTYTKNSMSTDPTWTEPYKAKYSELSAFIKKQAPRARSMGDIPVYKEV